MSSLLITGKTGFIGSHLVRYFSKLGFHVHGTTRSQPALPESGQFDAVIHCASQQPQKNLTLNDYEEVNVENLKQVLDWMNLHQVKKIITFSSVAVYGEGLNQEIDEVTVCNPTNDYGRSKLKADELFQKRSLEDGLASVCFRMPSVFGAGQGGGLVDTYFDLAIQNQDIEVYSEGKLKRNLLYIDEVEQACEKALIKLSDLTGFHLFLLGSSDSLTMGEIAGYIVEKLKSKSSVELVQKQAPLSSNWILRLDKVQSELGFVPKSIGEGMDRYITLQVPI